MSCGIAYTLQIAGQKYVNVILASILLSLESVFSVLAGWMFLGETLSMRENRRLRARFCRNPARADARKKITKNTINAQKLTLS